MAISGLDAHAYGSFRGSKTGDMWLRDYLKTDLPGCRTMIWGYDVKLSSPADHDLADYSSQFFNDLKRVRPTNVRTAQTIRIGKPLLMNHVGSKKTINPDWLQLRGTHSRSRKSLRIAVYENRPMTWARL